MIKIMMLGSYVNGNYSVKIYSDGTKVRENNLSFFEPRFAENCDVKITDKCDGGCEYCYEGCSQNGKHANLFGYPTLINSLHPYTEFALNGNDLSHPQLVPFLKILKEKKVLANITVNQKHFIKYKNYLKSMSDHGLIHGVGVSLVDSADKLFFQAVEEIPNVVIHTIVGITSVEQYFDLCGQNCKILILGYKSKGRGINYQEIYLKKIATNIDELKTYLPSIIKFADLVSFDNLAIEQLDVRNTLNVSDEQWNEFYMGDDGEYTFYIDLVNGEYGKNSISDKRYKILPDMTIDDMFNRIKSEIQCEV